MDEFLDLLDGFLDRADDTHFNQRDDEQSVKERNRQITDQTFPGIRFVILADDFHPAFLHEDKAEHVGEPISHDETGGEGRLVEPAHDPGARQGQRPIDEEVIPPRKRRKHVADEGQCAGRDPSFGDSQFCQARKSLIKSGPGRHILLRSGQGKRI